MLLGRGLVFKADGGRSSPLLAVPLAVVESLCPFREDEDETEPLMLTLLVFEGLRVPRTDVDRETAIDVREGVTDMNPDACETGRRMV